MIQAIDKFSKPMKKCQKDTKKLGKSVEKTSSIMNYGAMAAAALAGALIAFGISAVKSYLEAERTAQAFNIVVGETADLLLKDLKKASRGMVTDFDLMASANKALMLGIAKNQLPKLMEVAATRSKVMGITVTQAFNDITTGIGRQSKLILDNLGIIFNLEETYISYARTLGKTSDALTELEKKQAIVNMVIEKSEDLVWALNYASETHLDKLTRLSTGWKNFTEDLGGAIVVQYDFMETQAKALVGYELWSNTIKDPELTIALQGHANEIATMEGSIKLMNQQINAYRDTLMAISDVTLVGETQSSLDLAEAKNELDIKSLELMKLEREGLTEEDSQYVILKGEIENLKNEIDILRTSHRIEFNSFKEIQGLKAQLYVEEKDQVAKTKDEVISSMDEIKNAWETNRTEIQGTVEDIDAIIEKMKELERTAKEITIGDRVRRWIGGLIGIGSSGKKPESKQSGGYISETKPYLLHAGEEVIPANKVGKESGMVINIYGDNYGIDADDLANSLQDKLKSLIKY